MSDTIKVFELAKELDIKALDLIDKIKPLKLQVKNHMSDLSSEQAEQIKNFLYPKSAGAAVSDTKKVTTRKKVAVKKESAAAPEAVPLVQANQAKSEDAPKDSKPKTPGKRPPIIIRRDVSSPGTVTEKRTVLVEGVAKMEERTTSPDQQIHPEVQAAEEEILDLQLESDRAEFEAFEETQHEIEYDDDGTDGGIPQEAPSAITEQLEEGDVQATHLEKPAFVLGSELTEPELSGSAPAATVVAPTALVGRRPKYSVIRVVTAEPTKRAKPLIVEEASPLGRKTAAPKTFADPDLARTGSELLALQEDENRKRKSGGLGAKLRSGSAVDANFKSTDYLRRERVYQPKKKKISMGRGSGRASSTLSAAHKRVVEFDSAMSVGTLALEMNVKVHELSKKLRSMGVERPEEAESYQDWMLDIETAQLLGEEYNYEVRDVTFTEAGYLQKNFAEDLDDANLKPRAPVVTIMGHVDHGKTSLLDLIRRSRVAAGEAGGITQHIGAYTVNVNEAIENLALAQAQASGEKLSKKDKKKTVAKSVSAKSKETGKNKSAEAGAKWITFLDTPGHAVFTEMRSRGAKATDIVILVVAASEGVMPQTREAADHAKAAGVPILVAMNKMDLPDANPDRIRQQLSEIGIISEDWGGEAIFVPVSAKTGMGVDKLLEMIQLQSELMELKARDEGFAEGIIIEAKLDKGRGPLATVLVQSGELKQGQYVVAGTQLGKVRALVNDRGAQIKTAGPSTPVEILGLSGVPEAGELLNSFEDEAPAKELAEFRQKIKDKQQLEMSGNSDVFALMSASGTLKELPLIIKADVKGSAEAIQAALLKLPSDKVKIKILTSAVGAVGEGDVLLASASKALVVGFNVRADAKTQMEADKRKVPVRTYTIIYELIEDITKAMEGLLDPTLRESVLGEADVRNVFNITKSGTVAGCMVTKGKVTRNSSVRIIRDQRVVFTGKLSGLKRFKDDAREVAEGYECGVSVENYSDIKTGDRLEFFTVESISGTLGSGSGKSLADASA